MNNIFLKKIINNKEFITIFVLCLTILIFLLPLLTQSEKIFRDDGAYQAYLRLNGVARYIQQGEIPLWNPNTFCGGKPFYSMYEGPIYNIVLYPFMFFAKFANQEQTFYILYLLPFCLCMFIAGIGNYLFGRLILKLEHIPSFFIGLLYALNPSMVISIISLHNSFIFSYIPWILLTTIQYLKKPSIKWWLLTLLTLILLSTANNINYIIRIYFFSGLVSAIYALMTMKKDFKSLAVFLQLMTAFIFSAGILGFMWAGIYEGISWIGQTGKITYEFIADEKMNFGNLISIFAPNFTGLLNGTKAWGEAMSSNTNYIYMGGIFIAFSSFISLSFLFNKKNDEIKKIKPWILIGFIVLIGTILTMLSDRTPFFKIMTIILPWFFKIPFPHYYHFLQHWCMVLLTGIGIGILIKIKDINIYIKKYILFIYLGVFIIFLLISLFEPTEYSGGKIFSFLTIKYLNRLSWFLLEPVTYISSGIILLFIFTFFLNKKKLLYLVLPAIFLETIIFSYIAFYRGGISASEPGNDEPNEVCFESRFKNSTVQPYYQYMSKLDINISKDARYAGTITYIDNFAWLNNKYSLFGYDTKPMIKPLYDLMINFMEGYPYQMVPICLPKKFLSNMNVGYLVFKKYGETKVYDDESSINNVKYSCIKIKEDLYAEPANKIEMMKLDEPMPYIYTQNNIQFSNLNEQLEKIIEGDLRESAYIEHGNLEMQKMNNGLNKFNELQIKNKILNIKRNYANKLTLQAEINEPSLLIRSEVFHKGWKAYIDGKETKVYRLNFLQQGIWIDKGSHTIKFKFFPESIKIGFVISFFFIFCLGLILLYNFIFRKFFVKKNNEK